MLSHMQLHGDGIPACSLSALEGKAAGNGPCQQMPAQTILIVCSRSVSAFLVCRQEGSWVLLDYAWPK